MHRVSALIRKFYLLTLRYRQRHIAAAAAAAAEIAYQQTLMHACVTFDVASNFLATIC